MNKTFKKALAAFLAVLMVAFSVPFSALADVIDSSAPDSGMRMHFIATRYEAAGQFLGWSDYYADNGEIQYFDTRNMTMDDVAETKDLFALVITCEGEFKNAYATFDYNNDFITPAYFRRGTTVAAYESTTNETYKNGAASSLWETSRDVTGTTSVHAPSGGLGSAYFQVAQKGATMDMTGDKVFMPDDAPEQTLPGEIVAIFGFQLKQPCDLADVITVRPANNFTAMDVTLSGGADHAVLYGNGVNIAGKPTSYFTIPELGIQPSGDPQPPTKDTYTYTFADGTTQTVEVDAGATPTAPANTAAVTAHVDGTDTHKTTTYSWVADGDKAFKEVGTDTTADCAFKVTTPAVAPQHNADGSLVDGKTAVETCSECGYVKGGEVVKAAHDYTITAVPATCKVLAHNHYACACGYEYDADFTGELADHTWKPTGNTRGDANCQTPGEVEYKCDVCGETKWEAGAYGPHTLTPHEAVAADCVNGGNDAYWTCDVCNKMFSDAEGKTEITEIPATPAKGHTLTAHAAVAADCTNGGNDAYWTCDVCGKMFSDAAGTTEITAIPTTPAKGHNWVDVAEVPATRPEAGVAAGRYCTECDAREGFAVIPALGVDITVSGSSLGTATVNGEAVANAVKNVPYAQNYTLVAAANEGAKFIGWQVGGKLVSTEETYTTAAFADMTYVPVFAEDTTDAFEITFVDAYDNVVTTVSSAALPLAELPAAPEFAGVTFDAWSLDLDAVNALKEATTVVANYKSVETKAYTVTAPEGCTITVNGEEVASPAAAAYNDKITVTSADAQAWSVNGSTEAAAYGSTYTFYCGSDITVAPIAAVSTVPTVKMVSDDANGYKVKFLATRSVPEGYTLIESGFVYGKGMAADDLKLENVGKTAGSANATVKQAVCQNRAADGQFALNYGVKNMDAAASAVAYAICSGANGTVVYYSTAIVHPY